jgi:hypothetical protein
MRRRIKAGGRCPFLAEIPLLVSGICGIDFRFERAQNVGFNPKKMRNKFPVSSLSFKGPNLTGPTASSREKK